MFFYKISALNCLLGKSYGPLGFSGIGTIGYTYDAYDPPNGQYGRGYRSGMTDGSGSTTWKYDTRGRVSEETKTVTGSGSFKTQWGYNSADLVAWMKYPADNLGNLGEQLLYTYHAQGWLNTAINYAGYNYVQGTSYDAAGRVQLRTLGADVLRTDYVYFAWTTANGQGRLKRIMTGTPGAATSLQDLRYTYDAVGNILTIKDYLAGNPQTQTFTYDAADRLASGGSGSTYPSESYAYNADTGNLSSKAGVTLTYLDRAHR
ncbi:MAG: hypothetical protein A2136_07060 [Chloroflexi bacterium RBG_16_54_11]|nr:MAG: hypothetical protein A2136_07060 [Chloroflexi bacterium RBG_16_54_11]